MKTTIHRWSLRLGLLLILAGVVCFAIRMFNPAYLDASGMLHEPFYLVILGYAALFSGAVSLLISFGTRHHA